VTAMKLRDHWSTLLWAASAVVFLVLAGGSLTKEALAAAGFAFAGAAIARAIDIAQQRGRDKAAAEESRRRDFDETRRLAYMALLAPTTESPELVATVANALVHHGQDAPFEDAVTHLTAVVGNSSREQSVRWLKEQIDDITSKMQ
jgi:hypothetical protein